MTGKVSSIAIPALLILFILMVIGVRATFTSDVPGANDLFPRWKGAQLFWQQGIDPYSDEATAEIQKGMYGRLAQPDEDQVLFVYPFYTVFVMGPLVAFSYDWVQAIWLVTVMFAIVGGVALTLRLVEWRPPVWLLAFLLIWSIVFYHSTRTIILGQFAGLIYLWIVGCLLALKVDRDYLAGMLIAMTTVKPQMSFLLIPALLIWAIGQRRWRFLASAAVTMLLLTGMSWLLLPSWLEGFLRQVASYPAYTITPSPIRVITAFYLPQLGRPVELALIAGLLIFLAWQWRKLWHTSAQSAIFLYVISLTLIITNMVVERTATTNYIIMYVPLFLILKQIDRHTRRGDLWVAVLLTTSTVVTWWLFLATIEGDLEHPIMYLPLPFLLLLILIVGRKRWGPSSSLSQAQAIELAP